MKSSKRGVTVKDGLGVIQTFWRVHSSRDVVIYQGDMTIKGKWHDPAWQISSDGKRTVSLKLTWLGPAGRRVRRTTIDFGSRFLDGWNPVMSMSRYALNVIFYRHKLLEQSIRRKPLFERRATATRKTRD